MEVELIPVIEIPYSRTSFNDEERRLAGYGDLYVRENFLEKCYRFSDYPEKFISYFMGSGLTRIKDIPPENIWYMLGYHWDGYPYENTPYTLYPFVGGYILRINGYDVLFPRQGEDLSYISFWENIVEKGKDIPYTEFPTPVSAISDTVVHFYCVNEGIFPSPEKIEYEVPIVDLERAYKNVLEELQDFARELDKYETAQEEDLSSKLIYMPYKST